MTVAAFDEIVLPVSRSRAFFRATLWSISAGLMAPVVVMIYGALEFIPSGISNRVVDYAIAVGASPLLLATVWTALKGLRWFALGLWASPVEIVARPESLAFHFGPFGRRTYNVAELDIRYPFELLDDEDEGGFESFLPEEQQRHTLLPRILHPRSKTPLQRTILRFAAGEEADVARTLCPAIEYWQSLRAPLA